MLLSPSEPVATYTMSGLESATRIAPIEPVAKDPSETGSQLWPQVPSADATVRLARSAVAKIGRELLTSFDGRLVYRGHRDDQPAITADSLG